MKRLGLLVPALIIGLAPISAAGAAGPVVTPLVSTAWLEANIGADNLVVLDIRSASDFTAAHIPGSEQTDYPGAWRTTRDDVPWVLPVIADLEAYLSGIGIGNEVSVVVVPAGTGSTEIGGATWIYWVLKYLGHDEVAILDGGWNAWQGEARPTAAGPPERPEPRSFTAAPRSEILADTDYVAARLATDTVIVDARAPSQYAGTTMSSLVTRAGHIPGAISLDNALFYDAAANRLKLRDQLEAQLPLQLADRTVAVISYCNTGHWGSIDWFVLHELLGFADVRLYEGSMAAWSRRADLPLVTGPDP
jgi:thiosulfate/3-mercaptopyruvate sulfurtransferase